MEHEQTIIEKITQVLGDLTLTAGEITAAMEKEALHIPGPNLPGYISAVLAASKDGEGQPCFAAVSRGKYRALTKAERKARTRAAATADREAVQWLRQLSEEHSDHFYWLVDMGEDKIDAILDQMEPVERDSPFSDL